MDEYNESPAKNGDDISYSFFTITLHWSIALLCISLFALGLWMVDLQPGHPWYLVGPWLHKLLGTFTLFLLLVRFFWHLITPPPPPLENHGLVEKKIATITHGLLNLLLLLVCIVGNIIILSTSDPYSPYGTFNLSEVLGIENLEFIATQTHLILASVLMSLVVFHVLAAIKHHLIDKDRTLKRMLGL